jgi:hypothetical protein
VDVITSWMAHVGIADAADVARAIEALPGRPVYPGPHADPTLASFEWSVRADRGRVDATRFAYSVAPDRVSRSAVLGLLRARVTIDAALADVIDALHGAHFQVGLAAGQPKLYVYAAGAPADAIDRVLAAMSLDAEIHRTARAVATRPAAFVAVDLDTRAAKLYFEHGTGADAAAMLRAVGADRLAGIARDAPGDLGSLPAPFVVSVRADATGTRDATLHTKIDRAGERLDTVAGAEARGALASLSESATSRSLTLTPTYLGRLDRGGELVETLYYRLAKVRT